jgi:glutaredoxin-related protein
MSVNPYNCPVFFKEFELFRKMPATAGGGNVFLGYFISEKHPSGITSTYNIASNILTVVCNINDLKKYIPLSDNIPTFNAQKSQTRTGLPIGTAARLDSAFDRIEKNKKGSLGLVKYDEYLRTITITNNYGCMIVYEDLGFRAKDNGGSYIKGMERFDTNGHQHNFILGSTFSLRFFAIAPNQESNFLSTGQSATPTINITNVVSYFADNNQLFL